MIGISVYLSKENEDFNKNWIAKAAKNGFSSIFTSLHIPEDNPETYKDLLISLGSEAKKHQIDLFADIAPKSFEFLQVDINNVEKLADYGVTGLRVDYGFGVEEIVKISNIFKVSLNASTLTEEFLQELIQNGLNTGNTEAAHNFYPRPETGLARDYFIEKNKMLKKYHIGISAFIPGDGKKRQPLFLGLPTLEEHRYISSAEAYLDLCKNCYVDTIYIGDPSLSEETLERFSLLKDDIVPIRYLGEENNKFADFYQYLQGVKSNRPDPARDVIRIEGSRIDLHDSEYLEPNHTVQRTKGSITIDNVDYGRYAGEIHIALTDLSQQPNVNVIGHVIVKDIPLLQYIGGGSKFLLQKMN